MISYKDYEGLFFGEIDWDSDKAQAMLSHAWDSGRYIIEKSLDLGDKTWRGSKPTKFTILDKIAGFRGDCYRKWVRFRI